MIPHIKQRQGATNRATPNRKKAARLFNQDGYRRRALIEGVFGAEENRRHQMHCRGRPDGQPPAVRQGYGATAWNVRVSGRFEWVTRLKVPIPSYTADNRCTQSAPDAPICLRQGVQHGKSGDDGLAGEIPGWATRRNRRELRTNPASPRTSPAGGIPVPDGSRRVLNIEPAGLTSGGVAVC